MNRLFSWVVYLVRLVYTFKHIIAIFALSLTLFYLLAAETVQQRRTMMKAFSDEHSAVAIKEAAVRSAGDAVFRDPSRSGASITQQQVEALAVAVRDLRSALIAVSAPNSPVAQARLQYVDALTGLQGKLNLFEPGADGTIAVLTSLDAIGPPADRYHTVATDFLTSTWESFWAAF